MASVVSQSFIRPRHGTRAGLWRPECRFPTKAVRPCPRGRRSVVLTPPVSTGVPRDPGPLGEVAREARQKVRDKPDLPRAPWSARRGSVQEGRRGVGEAGTGAVGRPGIQLALLGRKGRAGEEEARGRRGSGPRKLGLGPSLESAGRGLDGCGAGRRGCRAAGSPGRGRAPASVHGSASRAGGAPAGGSATRARGTLLRGGREGPPCRAPAADGPHPLAASAWPLRTTHPAPRPRHHPSPGVRPSLPRRPGSPVTPSHHPPRPAVGASAEGQSGGAAASVAEAGVGGQSDPESRRARMGEHEK